MPPKKSTETNATAKGQAAEKTDTSKMPPKKEANNNDNDKPIVKPRSRRDTKPAVKMESADEDAEDAADEGTPGPETPKRGPGRPPKKNVQGTTPKRGPSRPPKTGAANKGKISQAFKETGGWVYAGEDVTADESTVVDKDENGNGRFPWASIITMKYGEPIEYHYHEHRTAYLVISGGRIAILRKASRATVDPSESAISGVLDKQSEVFIIPKNTMYRVGLQSKTVKYVEGHEVLDAATRDLWIVSGEIEWDDDVDSHAVGKVTQEVVDEGDVSGRVMAAWQAEQNRLVSEAAPEEEQNGVTTFKHSGAEASDSESDDDDDVDCSPSKAKKCSATDDHESSSLDPDVQGMGEDAGTAKEKNELKKSPAKKEGPKKERGTRGRAVRVKK